LNIDYYTYPVEAENSEYVSLA